MVPLQSHPIVSLRNDHKIDMGTYLCAFRQWLAPDKMNQSKFIFHKKKEGEFFPDPDKLVTYPHNEIFIEIYASDACKLSFKHFGQTERHLNNNCNRVFSIAV